MGKKLDKLFWGLFFILGAVFILVSRMGYLKDMNVFTLILAVFLAGCFLKSLFHVEFTGMLFSLAFLAILFSKELHIEAITPWPVLGAALLGSIGLNIIFHKQHERKWEKEEYRFEDHATTVNEEDGCEIHYGVTFGSSIKYINSDDFRRADLTCNFGAMKVYFDNAMIQNGSAEINVHCSFAGMELYIPKEWNVITDRASVSLAGITEKNHPQTNGSPVVTITGSVSFSGIEIIYI